MKEYLRIRQDKQANIMSYPTVSVQTMQEDTQPKDTRPKDKENIERKGKKNSCTPPSYRVLKNGTKQNNSAKKSKTPYFIERRRIPKVVFEKYMKFITTINLKYKKTSIKTFGDSDDEFIILEIKTKKKTHLREIMSDFENYTNKLRGVIMNLIKKAGEEA